LLQLQELGYTVELDVWDWASGEDFVARCWPPLSMQMTAPFRMPMSGT
jgi:hypothetical protein